MVDSLASNRDRLRDAFGLGGRLSTGPSATRLGLVALWTVNGIFLAITLAAFLFADVGVDWDIFTEAGRRYFDGGLYDWGDALPYRYSPLLAPLFTALAPIGYLGWSLLHFAALLTLPRKLALLLLVSAPLWNDVYNGNTVTFAFVAAWWALQSAEPQGQQVPRGNPRPVQIGRKVWTTAGQQVRGGNLAVLPFLILCVLIPRPVMLPVLGYILWTRREYVLPFALIAFAALVGAWMTGWLEPWIVSEIGNFGRSEIMADFGPSVLIGVWWYPVALALAAWFAVKGRLGIASVFSALTLNATYPMFLFLELGSRDADEARHRSGRPAHPSRH